MICRDFAARGVRILRPAVPTALKRDEERQVLVTVKMLDGPGLELWESFDTVWVGTCKVPSVRFPAHPPE